MNCVLEVIICSVEDALQAERGGATRLEIVRDLPRGGLTPSLSLVEQTLRAVQVPARVMLRERDDHEIGETEELDRLCSRAEEMARLPLDGLVLGLVHNDRVDLRSTSAILNCAPGLRTTFHHAFEATRYPLRAISELKTLTQVDRILTHGGDGNWRERIHRLDTYQRKAHPEIHILAGGGLNLERVNSICQLTQVREFHLGRAVRAPGNPFGKIVDAKVREFAALLRRKSNRQLGCPQSACRSNL